MIRAGGGLVWRAHPEDDVEVLVVHRPAYDDWSLPKGKAEPGESEEQAALREVQEETGWACRIEVPIAEIRYLDRKGRVKQVRYWRMAPVRDTGAFVPNDEIDEVAWWARRDALDRLTYEHDRRLVAALERVPPRCP